MSSLTHKRGQVFNSVNSSPEFGSAFRVTVYEDGAVASAASSGTTVTVYTGHGFAANDKLIVGTDTSTFVTVSVAGATSLTISSSLSISQGDVLVNLGPDTGSASPNYDGSGISIYTDPAGSGTAVSNSTVTCDSEGNYEYYHAATRDVWELVRNSSGTPVKVLKDEGGSAVTSSDASSTDNAIARWDGTTGRVVQDGYTTAATVDDSGNISATSVATTGAVTASGAISGTAITGTSLTSSGAGTITGDLEIDGALNHDGTTVGFYGTTPTTRPASYTQTYTGTGRNHQNPTGSALTDNSGGSASQTLAAITGGGSPNCEDATKNAIASLADEVNKLITDLANVKAVLNSVIDDLQALGLIV